MLLGILTGVGGGVARDVLVAEVPAVLRRVELYATAAALGAGIVVGGEALALPRTPVAMTGAVACFVLRFLALRRGWTLPVPRGSRD